MRRLALGSALVTILFWSSAFVGIRVGLTAFSAWHMVLLRFLTASAVLALGVGITGGRFIPPPRAWGRVIAAGVTGFTVYHTALTLGERAVSASTASFIIASAPMFSAMIAVLFLKERVSAWAWSGMAVSFGGVSVLSGIGAHFHGDALLIVVAAVATAVYFSLEKPLLQEFNALDVTAWVTWAGCAPMLLYGRGFIQAVIGAPLYPLLAVVYIGVFPAAVAYVTWSIALREADVGQVAPILYLNPIMASLLAWILLGTRPGWDLAGGGIMILIGVWLVQTRGRPSTKVVATEEDVG